MASNEVRCPGGISSRGLKILANDRGSGDSDLWFSTNIVRDGNSSPIRSIAVAACSVSAFMSGHAVGELFVRVSFGSEPFAFTQD